MSQRTKRFAAGLVVVVAVAIGALAIAACGAESEPTDGASPTLVPSIVPSVVPGTITDAAKAGDLGAFLSALTAAGLQAKLEEDGPFTVFAPNKDAFAAISLDQLEEARALKDVLEYHIIPDQNVQLADVTSGDTFTTDEGSPVTITIDDGATYVNDAQIVAAYAGSTWTLYVIDRILSPSRTSPSPM
jgi:uncharacterized surface protein with fasciclin (FAS1) repeats